MSLLSPQLQAFLAVTRTQTVHGAARELGLTQTGVTQRIRALETTLSTTLFTRSRKGMQLTQEGEALLRYCQASLDLEGEALARISGSGRAASVRICVTGPSSLMRSRIIPQCAQALRGLPTVTASFEINDLGSREDLLRTGKAQLAVLARERVAREMDSKLLKPEKYVLVGPPAWKSRPLEELARRERIIDFDPTDDTTFSYLKKFGLTGAEWPERHFVNNTEALAELLSLGLGFGVLTTEFAAPHLKAGRLVLLNRGAAFERQHALAWYPRPQMPEYFRKIIGAIH